MFVRAPVGHATLRGVDVTAARAMPGVLGVYAGPDLVADGLGAIPPVAGAVGRDGKPMIAAAMPVLAVDRIRYVGEPVAIVVAQTLAQAQDAAEQVAIDYAELASAADVERATAAGAAAIHARRPATSRSTGPMAMPLRSRPPSRVPPMSSACGSSTPGSRRLRWSRAPASDCGTPSGSATR